LIDMPGATPDEMCEAALAYSILGDELGVIISESLNDLAGAKSAYRKSLNLYTRALNIDSNLLRAKRGLATGLLEIVPIEKESDPEQGLKDAQLGLQRIAALPQAEQQSLRMIRVRESYLVDEAFVQAQMGRYSEADAIVVGSVESSKRRVAQDPQDLRSLGDLLFSLDRQAINLDIEADPALGASTGVRRRSLIAEEKALAQEHAGLDRMLQLNPSQKEWKSVQGDVEVRLGTVQSVLHSSRDSEVLIKKGLATLKEAIKEDRDSPEIIDSLAKDLLIAEPVSLRDPQLAVTYAERSVTLSHRKMPARLLTLAQAYSASGNTEMSRAAASEGLALLPTPQPGSVNPRLRRLLEIQAATGL
jgi:tetratricopeptide (TPR) repeat protein